MERTREVGHQMMEVAEAYEGLTKGIAVIVAMGAWMDMSAGLMAIMPELLWMVASGSMCVIIEYVKCRLP